jgi:hypothetical protein
MLRKFYLASVLIYPCQFCRVHCIPYFSTVKAPALPRPSVSGSYNYNTFKRYFRKQKKALSWAAFMVKTHTKGPLENPLLHRGQLFLF